MTITQGTKTVKDAAGNTITVSTINESVGSITSPAHGMLNGSTGLLIDPAIATNQLITRGTLLVASSTTITRPANTTAYAAGDIWANSATAGSCTLANSVFQFAAASANDIPGIIKSATLYKSTNVVLAASFLLHFFNVDPYATAPAVGDNGVFDQALAAAALAGYLGSLEVTQTIRGATNCAGIAYPTRGDFIEFTPVSGGTAIYAIPEVRNALVPASAEVLSCSIRVAG